MPRFTPRTLASSSAIPISIPDIEPKFQVAIFSMFHSPSNILPGSAAAAARPRDERIVKAAERTSFPGAEVVAKLLDL